MLRIPCGADGVGGRPLAGGPTCRAAQGKSNQAVVKNGVQTRKRKTVTGTVRTGVIITHLCTPPFSRLPVGFSTLRAAGEGGNKNSLGSTRERIAELKAREPRRVAGGTHSG